jgi:hypothetical protein
MCCVEQPQFVLVPTGFAIELSLEQQIGRQMEVVGIARTRRSRRKASKRKISVQRFLVDRD